MQMDRQRREHSHNKYAVYQNQMQHPNEIYNPLPRTRDNGFAPTASSNQFNYSQFQRDSTDSPPSPSLTGSACHSESQMVDLLDTACKVKRAHEPTNFHCNSCKSQQYEMLSYDRTESLRGCKQVGNCLKCGAFFLLSDDHIISQGIRDKDQHFQGQIPMDTILTRLANVMTQNRVYNPHAFYLRNRQIVVDWMCELSDKLRFQPETLHHSVGVYDTYFSKPNIGNVI